jgi:plastocyanin
MLSPFARGQSHPLGEVRGTITVTKPGDPEGERGDLFGVYMAHGEREALLSLRETAPSGIRLSERAVVFLESEEANRGRYAPPRKNPILNQKGLQFHPQVLPILVGTTVDFPNRDNLFHNVFSYSGPKEFDLGRYPMDDSRSVTFDAPGTVRVYCDIHTRMSATILVLQHPYFASPADDGDYLIANVPPGKYMVVFWYGREAVERRPVTVRAGDSAVENFTH